jgi:hypothetical protein
MDHETLTALARADARAKARSAEAHRALVRAIWEAAGEGMPQVEIVKDTGLTRERIRQLCDPVYRARHRTAVLGGPGQDG